MYVCCTVRVETELGIDNIKMHGTTVGKKNYVSLEFVVADRTDITTYLKIVCDGFWMQDKSCSSGQDAA